MLPVYSIVESTHLYSLAGVYPCLPLGSTKLRFEALKIRFNYVLRVSNHPSVPETDKACLPPSGHCPCCLPISRTKPPNLPALARTLSRYFFGRCTM